MAHHLVWVGRHTGGSRTKPTVHRAHFGEEAVVLLTNSTTHNNEPKKTQHDNNMVAEQVLRDLSVRRASVYAISRCTDQCVSMECADVLDVSNAV